MLEGRTLAEQLDQSGISVTIIADAAAALVMDRIDLVLVGADKLTPTELVNKIGTRMIALAARERGLPIYSLCDSTKFICKDYKNRTTRETGITAEIWQEAPRGLRLLNPYFEPTPLELFSGIVAEDGVLSVREAARRAEEVSIDPVLVDRLELPQST
jgi:translation initiation factor 2B subunit (eIF-2B alpha/beta/delta family)